MIIGGGRIDDGCALVGGDFDAHESDSVSPWQERYSLVLAAFHVPHVFFIVGLFRSAIPH
jgi:hypothetical protein